MRDSSLSVLLTPGEVGNGTTYLGKHHQGYFYYDQRNQTGLMVIRASEGPSKENSSYQSRSGQGKVMTDDKL